MQETNPSTKSDVVQESTQSKEMVRPYEQLAGLFADQIEHYRAARIGDVAEKMQEHLGQLTVRTGRKTEEMQAAALEAKRREGEVVDKFLVRLTDWLDHSEQPGGSEYINELPHMVRGIIEKEELGYDDDPQKIVSLIEGILQLYPVGLPPIESSEPGTGYKILETTYRTAIDRVVALKSQPLHPDDPQAKNKSFPTKVHVLSPSRWKELLDRIQK